MSKPPREVRPAPVLPPPQVPGSAYPAQPSVGPRAFTGQLPHYAPSSRPIEPPPPSYFPQAYSQYPQYQYYPSPPPPQRRSSGLASVLLALPGAIAGIFFLVVVLSSLAPPAVSAPGDISSRVPAPARNPNATPVDSDRAGAVLTANTLYEQGGLANGSCPATDLGSAGTEEQTRFYQSLMACLSAEWRPPIKSAGFGYTVPGLVVFDSPVSTPCGSASPESGRTLAFYCPGNAVMYADVPQMRRFFGGLDVAYAVVIGHEFGHHVQSETGMLAAYDDVVRADPAQRLESSRRLELQASCMGGLFLGAVADSFPVDSRRLTQLQQVAGAFGDEPASSADERDHGSGESNRRWILSGFDSNDVARCNTFTASSAEVN